ncbi:hypothetical protein HDU76_012722 [Blyttiomyces sp. JEL0837]|nr:hypothetical protein HDU76_012722 [Blyttiomyces sp. JEL0837]
MSYLKCFNRGSSSAKVGRLESTGSGGSGQIKDKEVTGSQDTIEQSENVDTTFTNSTHLNGSVAGKTAKANSKKAFGSQKSLRCQPITKKERRIYEQMTESNFENSKFWQLRLASEQIHFQTEQTKLQQQIDAVTFEYDKRANLHRTQVEKLRQQLHETVEAKNEAVSNSRNELQHRINQLEEEKTRLKSRVKTLQAEAQSDKKVALTKAAQLEAQISELRDNIMELQEQKEKLEVRNESLRKEVKRISKLVKDIRDSNLEEKDNLQTEIDELRSEKLDLQTRHEQAIRELKANFNVERANDTVHWHSRLDVKDKEIKEIKSLLKRCKQQLNIEKAISKKLRASSSEKDETIRRLTSRAQSLAPRQSLARPQGVLRHEYQSQTVTIPPTIAFNAFAYISDLNITNFELGRRVTMGSSKDVVLVREKRVNGTVFAMKLESDETLRYEIDIRRSIGNGKIPFVSNSHGILKVPNVGSGILLDYFTSGSLMTSFMAKGGVMTEDEAKFYASEIVLALYHKHYEDIVVRDLSLDNLMLDDNGHVNIFDLGSSIRFEHANTLAGSLAFAAPEILRTPVTTNFYKAEADCWSLGIALHVLLVGCLPFGLNTLSPADLKTPATARDQILFTPLNLPHTISRPAADLLRGLLTIEPKHGLATAGKIGCIWL